MKIFEIKGNVNGFKEPSLVLNLPLSEIQIWEMKAVRHPFYTVVGWTREECIAQAIEQEIEYLQIRN